MRQEKVGKDQNGLYRTLSRLIAEPERARALDQATTAGLNCPEASGQDRGSNAVACRPGQEARRTFPPFVYETAPGIGAQRDRGSTAAHCAVSDPRSPMDTLRGYIRRDLRGLCGQGSLAGASAARWQKGHSSRAAGYRAAVTKIVDRCTRDGDYNDPLSLDGPVGAPASAPVSGLEQPPAHPVPGLLRGCRRRRR